MQVTELIDEDDLDVLLSALELYKNKCLRLAEKDNSETHKTRAYIAEELSKKIGLEFI